MTFGLVLFLIDPETALRQAQSDKQRFLLLHLWLWNGTRLTTLVR